MDAGRHNLPDDLNRETRRLRDKIDKHIDRLTYQVRHLQNVLEIREKELLSLKGSCSNKSCKLHKAHDGPCGPGVRGEETVAEGI